MKMYREVAGRQGSYRSFRFDADGRRANWILHDSYCDKPLCTGMEVRIALLVDGEPERRLAFEMDLAKSAISLDPETDETRRAIAVEFGSNPGVQRLLWRHRTLVRAWGMSHRDHRGNVVVSEGGGCCSLAEFDPHGEQHAMAFESDGATWAAIDSYCLNPSCACNEAILEFYGGEPGAGALHPRFAARLGLVDGRLTEAATSAPLEPDQRRVVADLQQEVDPWRGELGLRRKLIRRIGAKRRDARYRPSHSAT